MEMLFVRPAPGMRVRDPATRAPIPEEGVLVPHTGYWERRIRTGDVVVAEPPVAPQPKSKSKE